MLHMALLVAQPGEVIAIMTITLSLMYVTVRLLTPIMQGLGKRLGGQEGRADAAFGAELEELRARVRDLEDQQGRLVELEERLDFTERLLARQQDVARLPEH